MSLLEKKVATTSTSPKSLYNGLRLRNTFNNSSTGSAVISPMSTPVSGSSHAHPASEYMEENLTKAQALAEEQLSHFALTLTSRASESPSTDQQLSLTLPSTVDQPQPDGASGAASTAAAPRSMESASLGGEDSKNVRAENCHLSAEDAEDIPLDGGRAPEIGGKAAQSEIVDRALSQPDDGGKEGAVSATVQKSTGGLRWSQKQRTKQQEDHRHKHRSATTKSGKSASPKSSIKDPSPEGIFLNAVAKGKLMFLPMKDWEDERKARSTVVSRLLGQLRNALATITTESNVSTSCLLKLLQARSKATFDYTRSLQQSCTVLSRRVRRAPVDGVCDCHGSSSAGQVVTSPPVRSTGTALFVHRVVFDSDSPCCSSLLFTSPVEDRASVLDVTPGPPRSLLDAHHRDAVELPSRGVASESAGLCRHARGLKDTLTITGRRTGTPPRSLPASLTQFQNDADGAGAPAADSADGQSNRWNGGSRSTNAGQEILERTPSRVATNASNRDSSARTETRKKAAGGIRWSATERGSKVCNFDLNQEYSRGKSLLTRSTSNNNSGSRISGERDLQCGTGKAPSGPLRRNTTFGSLKRFKEQKKLRQTDLAESVPEIATETPRAALYSRLSMKPWVLLLLKMTHRSSLDIEALEFSEEHSLLQETLRTIGLDYERTASAQLNAVSKAKKAQEQELEYVREVLRAVLLLERLERWRYDTLREIIGRFFFRIRQCLATICGAVDFYLFDVLGASKTLRRGDTSGSSLKFGSQVLFSDSLLSESSFPGLEQQQNQQTPQWCPDPGGNQRENEADKDQLRQLGGSRASQISMAKTEKGHDSTWARRLRDRAREHSNAQTLASVSSCSIAPPTRGGTATTSPVGNRTSSGILEYLLRRTHVEESKHSGKGSKRETRQRNQRFLQHAESASLNEYRARRTAPRSFCRSASSPIPGLSTAAGIISSASTSPAALLASSSQKKEDAICVSSGNKRTLRDRIPARPSNPRAEASSDSSSSAALNSGSSAAILADEADREEALMAAALSSAAAADEESSSEGTDGRETDERPGTLLQQRFPIERASVFRNVQSRSEEREAEKWQDEQPSEPAGSAGEETDKRTQMRETGDLAKEKQRELHPKELGEEEGGQADEKCEDMPALQSMTSSPNIAFSPTAAYVDLWWLLRRCERWKEGYLLLTWDRFLLMYRDEESAMSGEASFLWTAFLPGAEIRKLKSDKSEPAVLEVRETKRRFTLRRTSVAFRPLNEQACNEWLNTLQGVATDSVFFSAAATRGGASCVFLEKSSSASSARWGDASPALEPEVLSDSAGANAGGSDIPSGNVSPLTSPEALALPPQIPTVTLSQPARHAWYDDGRKGGDVVFPLSALMSIEESVSSAESDIRSFSHTVEWGPLRSESIDSSRIDDGPLSDGARRNDLPVVGIADLPANSTSSPSLKVSEAPIVGAPTDAVIGAVEAAVAHV